MIEAKTHFLEPDGREVHYSRPVTYKEHRSGLDRLTNLGEWEVIPSPQPKYEGLSAEYFYASLILDNLSLEQRNRELWKAGLIQFIEQPQ